MPRAIAPGMFFLRLKGIGVFDLNLSFIKCSYEHTNLEHHPPTVTPPNRGHVAAYRHARLIEHHFYAQIGSVIILWT